MATVFAPTNDAFMMLLKQMNMTKVRERPALAAHAATWLPLTLIESDDALAAWQVHAFKKESVWTSLYVRYVGLSSDMRAVVQAQLLSSYILKPTLMYHVVPGVAAMVGALVHNRAMQDSWVVDNLLRTTLVLNKHALDFSCTLLQSKLCNNSDSASLRCASSLAEK